MRSLVALHGGSIEVLSDGATTGSEFIVSLPLDAASQPGTTTSTGDQVSRGAGKVLRILVADDNDDGREMLSYFLETEGHVVATAVDGESALATAVEFKPDVAILDIGMPRVTGYAVATRIRETMTPPPVLVALSGLGQAEDKARAIEAGFDRHFTKPVDIRTLTHFLANLPKR